MECYARQTDQNRLAEGNSGSRPPCVATSVSLLLEHDMDTKICTACRQEKPLSEFHKSKACRYPKSKCKPCQIDYHKRRRLRDPARNKAHETLRSAVKRGKIVKPKICSCCRKEALLDGHHPDYDKPLEVVWLCPMCHRHEHKPIKICSMDNCNEKHHSKGFCNKHYQWHYWRGLIN